MVMTAPPRPAALIAAAVVLAAGIAGGGFFVGRMMYNSKIAINTAEAKGLAERRVTSDSATWNVSYSVTGKSRDELPELYRRAEEQQKVIKELLIKNGLTEDMITIGIIDYSVREYRNEEQILVEEKHTCRGSLYVETEKVELIPPIRFAVNKLIAQGFEISNPSPSYHFTGINLIKPDMLKEAARNARIAANEFAENAGAKVGRIRSATQGAFTVVDVGATHGDTRKIEKNVRVVTRMEFYIKD